MKPFRAHRLTALLVTSVVALGLGVTPASAATGSAQVFAISGVNNINDVSGEVAVCTTYSADYVEGRAPAETSIVAVNLTTGVKSRLVTHSWQMLEVTYSGRYVIWLDRRTPVDHVWGYDTLTGVEFPVATDAGTQGFPGVDGEYAVWTHEEAPSVGYFGRIHVEGMNLRTGERFVVSSGPGYQFEPRVSNGWIVYTDVPTGPSKAYIRAYQIATGKTYTLNRGTGHVGNPDIGSSGIAVWTQQSGSVVKSYSCSVYDRRVTLVQSGTGFGGAPRVTGNVVAYPLPRKHGFQIEGYDTLAGTRFTVAPSSQALVQYMPIDDGRVAWIEQNTRTYVNRLCVGSPTVIGTYSATDVYSTAVAQSQGSFPDGAETVVLANGSIWDDVAVGAGLAGDDSPLLLTGRDSLPASVASELTRLAPKHVEVVGGTGSVSDAVLAQIASCVASDTVVGRTGGSAAADTALRALESAVPTGALSATALGSNFGGTVVVVSASDKVTSGLVTPVLRARKVPVVFAGKSLTARELGRLRAAGVKRAIIVGGTKGVSAYSAKQLSWLLGKRAVTRIAGKSVYQTSARFNEYAIRRFGMSLNGVGIATNSASTDMLMAGLKNGKGGSLLLLTGAKTLSKYAAGELKARHGSIRRAQYVGRGKRLVSRAVRKSVRLIVH